MSLCNIGSFTNFLVIVLVISESPGNAFTIRRTNVTEVEPPPDLTPQESVLLEVKKDFSSPNYIKVTKDFGKNDGKVEKVAPLNKPVDVKKYNILRQNHIARMKEYETEKLPQIKKLSSRTTTSRFITNSPFTDVEDHIAQMSLEDTSPSITTTPGKTSEIKLHHDLRDNVFDVNDDKESENIPRKDLARSITDTEKADDNSTYTSETENLETTPETDYETSDSTTPIALNDITTESSTDTESSSHISTKTSTQSEVDDMISIETNTGDVTDPIGSEKNTESMTAEHSSSVTAPVMWKKYTTIERKRPTTTEINLSSTEKDQDTEITNIKSTRISLENAFSSSPIPSIEQLKNDLLSNKLATTKISKDSLSSTPQAIKEMESKSTFSLEVTTDKPKFGEISSKRGGFLDYSTKSKSEPTPIASSVTTLSSRTDKKATKAEIFSSIFDDAHDVDGSDYKNAKGTESQSQLTEDAIKEEFLREEALNNQAEHANRYQEDEVVTIAVVQQPSPTPHNGSNDELSVKPINQDKGKALYTVSPNYKPLKRIEVQPPKPFMRHPDDNSWRNESISSLGIVFKPKNASKALTQVLKNKTETELNSTLDKDNKNDLPDLRVRLEKIAEKRKSRKKKVDQFGSTIYTDYEEGNLSGENASTASGELTTVSFDITNPEVVTITTLDDLNTSILSPSSKLTEETEEPATTLTSTSKDDETTKILSTNKPEKQEKDGSTKKPNKPYNLLEYYDTSDDYLDYANLSNIDIKKFTERLQTKETPITPIPTTHTTKPSTNYPPGRKGTIQYFPPRVTQKTTTFSDYDNDFQRKINMYTIKDSFTPVKSPKKTTEILLDTSYPSHPNYPSSLHPGYSSTPVPPYPSSPAPSFPSSPPPSYPSPAPNYITNKLAPSRHTVRPVDIPRLFQYEPHNLPKNVYLTQPPHLAEQNAYQVDNHENLNRPSYVLKHYNFLKEAAKDNDYDKTTDFIPVFTPETPIKGVTLTDVTKDKIRNMNEDYDYESEFRKDVLSRFVDNFNQNSDRFKVDFPILYNNSIVHRHFEENGRALASSRAFLKRLYNDPIVMKPPNLRKPCDPNCEKLTIELSPDYELHYYVPEQEEKEEVEPKPVTLPYRYRL